jgi:hydrogenase/urease accessory protein HupE
MVQPYMRPETMVMALAGGYLLGDGKKVMTIIYAFVFMLFIATGAAIAFSGIDLPFAATAIPLSIVITGIALVFPGRMNVAAGLVFCCGAGLYHGWSGSSWLLEHVSDVLPSFTGGLILLFAIIAAGATLRSGLSTGTAGRCCRFAGMAMVAWSFWMRIGGYRVSEFREMSVSAAGGIEIPVLAVLVLAAALIVLLRKNRKSPFPGAALLALSLFLVPVGAVTLGGGPSSLAEMSDEDASALLAGLLENTYRAVNLRGEDEIYDRLATSVDGDLVETIYLESRRRSVMPGQADTEAKLIGVRVVDVTDRTPVPEDSGYSFTTTWMVTGTVRHWAHKHNRLNRYNGVITIKAVGDLWKISGLELLDETRL